MSRLPTFYLSTPCFGLGRLLRKTSASQKQYLRLDLTLTSLMNFLSTEADFFHYFTICNPKLVVIDPSLHDMTVRALDRVPSLGRVDIISLGGSHPGLVNVRCQLSFPSRRRLRFHSTHRTSKAKGDYPYLISHWGTIEITPPPSVSAQERVASRRV